MAFRNCKFNTNREGLLKAYPSPSQHKCRPQPDASTDHRPVSPFPGSSHPRERAGVRALGGQRERNPQRSLFGCLRTEDPSPSWLESRALRGLRWELGDWPTFSASLCPFLQGGGAGGASNSRPLGSVFHGKKHLVVFPKRSDKSMVPPGPRTEARPTLGPHENRLEGHLLG